MTPDAFAPVAITTRSGFDESVHFGAVVGLDRSGAIAVAVGEPSVTIYPRSSNKPMQAVAMVRRGLRLPPRLLALVCASHDGTPMHIAGVREILDGAGLDESTLANTSDLPLERESAEAVLRAGGTRNAVQMNCSGKHAGMLATCVVRGWAADDSYLDVTHPLQAAITEAIDELSGGHVHIGVDGCGAPAHAMSLLGLAQAFRAIATGAAGDAGDQVATALRAHPEMVGGARRDVTALMRHVPGLIAKDGADGVFAAALPDGRAVALKIGDGASRARSPVMVAALDRLGVDVTAVAPFLSSPILGHGQPVGDVRALPV